MTLNQVWQYPDWIYIIQKKIQHIDLTKFPSYIYLEHKVLRPEQNKHLFQWAVCVNVRLEIKDRINGQRTTLVNPDGIYLYSEKNFEEIVYVEIERLLVHELKECFQIRENLSTTAIIPFDPHNTKRARIKFSTYDKIDIYRNYPSWRAFAKVRFGKSWKKLKAKLYDPCIKALQNLGLHIMKIVFIETKSLGEGPKINK
jgi:hypothetical protein